MDVQIPSNPRESLTKASAKLGPNNKRLNCALVAFKEKNKI